MFQKKVLIITPFFLPNIGGAETYAYELCNFLNSQDCLVNVLTYQPITTKGKKGKSKEKKGNIFIRRYQWIGYNLFHKLEKIPFLNFFYLTPYLLIRSIIWMLFNSKKVEVIDAQGFNSAIVALVLKLIFRKKAVVSVMSLYDFQKGSLISNFITWIISKLDYVIVESKASKEELIKIGVKSSKITAYTEWVSLDLFRPFDKLKMKRELGLSKKFSVLFVGRAIKIKGAEIILEIAKNLASLPIEFVFISSAGPMIQTIKSLAKRLKNIRFIPGVPYALLAKYESAADLAVVPSKYSENAAITAIIPLACGTPVIVSNKGALPDLIDASVGIITKPKVKYFQRAILKFFHDQNYYFDIQKKCRQYAENNFSIKNAQTILNVYNKVCFENLKK